MVLFEGSRLAWSSGREGGRDTEEKREMLMGTADGVLRFHQQQLPRLEVLQRVSGYHSSFPRQLIRRAGGRGKRNEMLLSTSHSYSCRAMASRIDEHRTSPSLPCLVLPPNFAHVQIEDDDDDHREEDYYYWYYSLGEKRVLGVKDSSGNKRRLLPWEKEFLLPTDAYCVASSHGWLTYLNPNDDCSLLLLKHPPLSSHDFFASEMFRLPPLQTHPHISRVVTRKAAADPNRPRPVTRDYFSRKSDNSSSFSSSSSEEEEDEEGEEEDEEEHHRKSYSYSPISIPEMFLAKLVLSSPPSPSSSPLSSFPPADSGCVALAIIQRRVLTFCRLGYSQWTPLDESAHYGLYNDIMYSAKDRCFYSLSDCGVKREHQLLAWDLANPFSPRKTIFNPTPVSLPSRKWRSPSPCSYQYLVECSGEILMVLGFMEDGEEGNIWTQSQGFCDRNKVQQRCRTVDFDVYKLDQPKEKWEMVEGIGDHALFLGLNHSFSLSTRDFPQLRSNSIYFTDHPIEEYLKAKGSPDPQGYPNMGIFNMHDKSIEPCYPFNVKSIHPHPIWVAPIY